MESVAKSVYELPRAQPLPDSTADLVQRLVAAHHDDPGLLASIEALQARIEERTGPEHLDHVFDRFQCGAGLPRTDPVGKRGRALRLKRALGGRATKGPTRRNVRRFTKPLAPELSVGFQRKSLIFESRR